MEHHKDAYYLALRTAQTSFAKADADWEARLRFFLEAMREQVDRLRQRLNTPSKLSALAERLYADPFLVFKFSKPRPPQDAAIVQGNHKLIKDLDTGEIFLFHLKQGVCPRLPIVSAFQKIRRLPGVESALLRPKPAASGLSKLRCVSSLSAVRLRGSNASRIGTCVA